MTAEQPAYRDGSQPGKAQRAAQPRVTGRERSPVQAQRDDIADGVDDADAHLRAPSIPRLPGWLPDVCLARRRAARGPLEGGGK
jgi:hypothetical protein